MIDPETIDLVSEVAARLADRLEKNFQIIPTLTLSQAAEALGVSDEKMRQLCNEGKIPYIRMDRLYRLKPADINAYLEQNYNHPQRRKETSYGTHNHHQNQSPGI